MVRGSGGRNYPVAMAEPTAKPNMRRVAVDLTPSDLAAVDLLALGQGTSRYNWLRQAIWQAMLAQGVEPQRTRVRPGFVRAGRVKAGDTW